MKVEWSAEADRDIDEIWMYIADDNVDAADRAVDRLRRAGDRLRAHSALGRRGKFEGTRELAVANSPYLLIYRTDGQSIEVLRVLHGARKWPPEG